ncbi:glycoside hydrolase family 76 protein [Xylariomycetidae sp. FL2044]|nr:glycoside hydrolase family 76 protein [Xylariomycetidae sp. FL2044]
MKTSGILTASVCARVGIALDLNVNDTASITEVASQIAKGLYTYHNPSSTCGQFNHPETWFWWLSGSAWNGLMDYTVYTNDTTYQADLLSSITQNVGPNYDFVPPEQAGWEANDDQAYWVYNALAAMEYDFEPLPCETSPDTDTSGECANAWLAIATNAFELYVSRWNKDSASCNGGLKWQYDPAANGYYYKNSVSNGGFFQTAARLARYTGNQTFADWATRVWDWSTGVGFVSPDYHVYDGAGDEGDQNCSAVNTDEWSYNIATYMHGAAHMYAFMGSDDAVWEDRVRGLVTTASEKFFLLNGSAAANATASAGIMYEQKCEPDSTCTTDQTSFKSSLSRWMGKTALLVPSVRETVLALLRTSAEGAAASCVGYGNSTCGLRWTVDGFDGQTDFGVELSALEVVQSLLVLNVPELATASS